MVKHGVALRAGSLFHPVCFLCPTLVPHMGLSMVWHSVPGVYHHHLRSLSAERVTIRSPVHTQSLREIAIGKLSCTKDVISK